MKQQTLNLQLEQTGEENNIFLYQVKGSPNLKAFSLSEDEHCRMLPDGTNIFSEIKVSEKVIICKNQRSNEKHDIYNVFLKDKKEWLGNGEHYDFYGFINGQPEATEDYLHIHCSPKGDEYRVLTFKNGLWITILNRPSEIITSFKKVEKKKLNNEDVLVLTRDLSLSQFDNPFCIYLLKEGRDFSIKQPAEFGEKYVSVFYKIFNDYVVFITREGNYYYIVYNVKHKKYFTKEGKVKTVGVVDYFIEKYFLVDTGYTYPVAEGRDAPYYNVILAEDFSKKSFPVHYDKPSDEIIFPEIKDGVITGRVPFSFSFATELS